MKIEPPKIVNIAITGPVASGKSAVLASIKKLLESHNYAVVYPKRRDRLNPPDGIVKSPYHEKPNPDKTVFVLHEAVAKAGSD